MACEIVLRRISQDLADDKSILVQVMAWCRQATSHYLSQCWPRSMSPYVITRPQWVNRKQAQINVFQMSGVSFPVCTTRTMGLLPNRNSLSQIIWNLIHLISKPVVTCQIGTRSMYGNGVLSFDTLKSEHNGRHIAEYIFKCISLKENFCILIQLSLKFVSGSLSDNKSALFQVKTFINDNTVHYHIFWHNQMPLLLTWFDWNPSIDK